MDAGVRNWRRGSALAAGAVVATIIALLPLLIASAQEPPRLTGSITDQTGTLAGDEARVQDALDELLAEADIQLFVLFVETTGSATITGYADAVAAANSLGGNDALMVVAMTDGTLALYAEEDTLSDEDITRALSAIEPRLRDGDFPGAIIAAADTLRDDASSGESGGGSNTGFIVILVIIGIAVAGIVALIVVRKVRGARQRAAEADERDRQTGALAKEANQLLLAADDHLRDAEQELGFAEAEFSGEQVAPFKAALASAREEVRAAFTIRQQLDDDRPEDAETRLRMLKESIAHLKKAETLVDEQQARIEQLRDLERTAPDILAKLPARLSEIEARAISADATIERLRRYAESAWQPFAGNAAEARKRIAFARQAVTAGQQAHEAGNSRGAADAAASAQSATAEAEALLDAVLHQEEAIEEALRNLRPELAAAGADVAAARKAITDGSVAGADVDLARAEATLQAAETEAAASQSDPVAAYRLAAEANAAADRVLETVRAADEQRVRATAAAASALAGAETSYRRAQDYLVGKREGVGRTARTRLAEAERHMQAARSLRETDIGRAAGEAQSAQRLADDAYRLAREDFDRHDRPQGGSGGGLGGLGGGILEGMILGGILGNSRGGGFGGSNWGSPSSGSSRGGFSIPRSSGGRSIGRSFGGGGGRSRGGRWK